MNYQEKTETVTLSESLYEKTNTYPFTMLTTGTGSGKTFVTIRTAWLHDPNASLLLFMPKSKKIENGWIHALQTFNDAMDANIVIKQHHYHQMISETGQVEIANSLNELRERGHKIIIAYDEAHTLKLSTAGKINNFTKFAQKLQDISGITARIGITATPSPNSYLDWGSYFVLAGFYKSKSQFIDEHIRFFDERHMPIVKDRYTKKTGPEFFKNAEKLDAQIEAISVYTDTGHLLPSVIKKDFIFEMDQSKRFIDEELYELYNVKEPHTRREFYNLIPKLLKKGYFENQQTAFYKQIKLMAEDPYRCYAIIKILQGIEKENPHPVLIFYQYIANYDMMVAAMKKYLPNWKIQSVNGKKKEVKQPTDSKTVIFIQYISGSAAIEFKTALTSIFAMPMYKYQDYTQAIGRNVRAGSTQTVTHWRIICKNSIDEDIWHILEQKGDFGRKMIDTYYKI